MASIVEGLYAGTGEAFPGGAGLAYHRAHSLPVLALPAVAGVEVGQDHFDWSFAALVHAKIKPQGIGMTTGVGGKVDEIAVRSFLHIYCAGVAAGEVGL